MNRNKEKNGQTIRCHTIPCPLVPLAVLPTRWMYSFGSSGGSYCTIQSTFGMSNPRAATSVHNRIPCNEENEVGRGRVKRVRQKEGG